MGTKLETVIKAILDQSRESDQRMKPVGEEALVLPYRVAELTARRFVSIVRQWGTELGNANPPCYLKVHDGWGEDDALTSEYKQVVGEYAVELGHPQGRSTTIGWNRLRWDTKLWRFDLVIATYCLDIPVDEAYAVIAFTYGEQCRFCSPGEAIYGDSRNALAASEVFLLPTGTSCTEVSDEDFETLILMASQYCQWLEKAVRAGLSNCLAS